MVSTNIVVRARDLSLTTLLNNPATVPPRAFKISALAERRTTKSGLSIFLLSNTDRDARQMGSVIPKRSHAIRAIGRTLSCITMRTKSSATLRDVWTLRSRFRCDCNALIVCPRIFSLGFVHYHRRSRSAVSGGTLSN